MTAYVTRVQSDLDAVICLDGDNGQPDQRWTFEIRRLEDHPGWTPAALDVPPDVRAAIVAWAAGESDVAAMLRATEPSTKQ